MQSISHIEHEGGLTLITLHTHSADIICGVLRDFAQARVSLRLVNSNGAALSIVIPDSALAAATRIIAMLKESEPSIKCESRSHVYMLSLSGEHLDTQYGVAAHVMDTLRDNGIAPGVLCAQGNTVRCIMSEDECQKALRHLS